LKHGEQINHLFRDLIISYLYKGNAAFSKKFAVEFIDSRLTAILRDTAELFILAHEYGHIVLNHLSLNNKAKRELAKNLGVEVWEINWEQEFQADEFASIAVVRINHVLNDMEAPMAFAGVPFIFSILKMLYECLGAKFSVTHPSPEQRVEKLYKNLYLDTDDKELVNQMKDFGDAIDYIITSLWRINRNEVISELDKLKQNL
jgi:hypothetical protein